MLPDVSCPAKRRIQALAMISRFVRYSPFESSMLSEALTSGPVAVRCMLSLT